MKHGTMSQWTLIALISMEDLRPPSSLLGELCSTSQFGTLEGLSLSLSLACCPARCRAALSSVPSLSPSLPPHLPTKSPRPPAFPSSLHSAATRARNGHGDMSRRECLRGCVSPPPAHSTSQALFPRHFCIVWRTAGPSARPAAAAADTDRIWAIPYGAIRIFHAA